VLLEELPPLTLSIFFGDEPALFFNDESISLLPFSVFKAMMPLRKAGQVSLSVFILRGRRKQRGLGNHILYKEKEKNYLGRI